MEFIENNIALEPITPSEFKKHMDEYYESLRHCVKCGERLDKTELAPSLCWKCRKLNEQEKKMIAIKKEISNLTLEERISRIEFILHDHFRNHPEREVVFR